MKYYVFKLFAPRATFVSDMTPEERALMQAHSLYWRELMNKGLIVVFGPVLDPAGPYGLGVVRLEEGIDPKTLWGGDPVIMAEQGFRYDVAPMAAAVLPQ